jgi:hypothetical protein
MSTATLVGIFIIPVFYVLMQRLAERMGRVGKQVKVAPP